MSLICKSNGLTSNKRERNKINLSSDDEKYPIKKSKNDISSIMGDVSSLNKNRIYNYGYVKKPAELFRKDLISAMQMGDGEQLSREDYILITDTWKEEWEKGVQVPVNPESLPEPKFRTINCHSIADSKSKLHRALKKAETDADCYGKYELDLQDICWLNSLAESEESIHLSERIVEDLINELEHQCAQNIKSKHVGIEYDDHVICDVCRSPEAEDGNEMVFCDSCNICVHQACYGITVIPDGEWICRPCKELGGYQKDLSCILCPSTGGALKPTTVNGEWAHVACALWIPEVNIGCVKLMEPITKIKQIPQTRWDLVCSICKIKEGAPIQCSMSSCKVAYHVTCAFNEKLKMKAIAVDDKKGVRLKSYCHKHSDKDDEKDIDFLEGESTRKNNDDDNHHEIEIRHNSESDDCYDEFWKYIDVNHIQQEFLPLMKEEHSHLANQVLLMYIDLVLQYWKLKRVSNYGSPLIKMISDTSFEKIRLQQHAGILRFRVDLERIRNLSYMLCRREKIKRNWLCTHQSTVEKSIAFATGSIPSVEDESNKNGNQDKDEKTWTPSEEKSKLAKSIINTSIIYDEKNVQEKNNAKNLLKQLKSMMRNDAVEKLRRHRPNPYAKFYLQRRSDQTDSSLKSGTIKNTLNGSTRANISSLVNGYSHRSSPLKSKALPMNGVNNTNENTLSGKNIIKSIEQNESPKIASNLVITRSSAFVGYKIPKKKSGDNSKDNDQSRKTDANYSVSPLKNSHNERMHERINHHYLRRPAVPEDFKRKERIIERKGSFKRC